MAFQSIWFHTELPEDVVEIVEKDFERFKVDQNLEESRIGGNGLDEDVRKARNTWIPTTHWIAGFIWHYVDRANRENFRYDLTCVDGESLQYTVYGEGEHYTWHHDEDLSSAYKPQNVGYRDKNAILNDKANIDAEYIRKLSFSLQLTDETTYEGGNFQLMDGKSTYFAPRKRGTLIVFDSRAMHRVLPVTKGIRKSIVGWTLGPRWR